VVELMSSWVDVAMNAVSTEVGDAAVSAGGASRPHSQFEEPRDGSGGVSDSVSQHEWVAGEGSVGCCRWQSSPSPHRPHGPAIGAAITSPGRSRATTAAARKERFRFILILEQYCTCFHFVKGGGSF
jgi:hypothetical protein